MVLIRRITQTNAQPIGLLLTRFLIKNLEFAGQSVYPFCSRKHSSIRLDKSASKRQVFRVPTLVGSLEDKYSRNADL
jgi:hypothetical protein